MAHRLPVVAAILCGVALSGQALTDHAAAIAGASAGVAGATAIRDPLSRILDAAAGTTNSAAAEAPRPNPKPVRNTQQQGSPAAAPATPPGESPAPSGHGRPAWRRGTESRSAYSGGGQPYDRYESAGTEPQPRQVTTAQLTAVASGASQSEVLGSLGVPSARIVMDDNGHLVEILQYSSKGSRVGSIRCTDGKVESVSAAQ